MDKNRTIQSAINHLRVIYNEFIQINEPKDNPGVYREVAAIIGQAVIKIEKLKD